jgi:hypothetical protein
MEHEIRSRFGGGPHETVVGRHAAFGLGPALVLVVVVGCWAAAEDGPLSPKTPCGSKICDSAREICVGRYPMGPTTGYACASVPNSCSEDRTCDCLGKILCTGGMWNECFDEQESPNTILCFCRNCQ